MTDVEREPATTSPSLRRATSRSARLALLTRIESVAVLAQITRTILLAGRCPGSSTLGQVVEPFGLCESLGDF